MKIISYLLRRSRGLGVLAVITGMISGGCSASVVALLSASARGESTLDHTTRFHLFLVLVLLVPISTILTQYLVARLAENAVYKIRRELGRRILDTPLQRLEELGSHRLLTVLTQDISNISNAVVFLPALWINLVFLVALFCYLAWLSWFEMSILTLAILLALLLYRVIATRAMTKMRFVRRQSDTLYDHYRALTHGTKELKLHQGRHGDFFAVYDRTANSIRGANVLARTLFMAAGSWMNFIILATLGFILFVLPELRPGSDSATLTTVMIIMLFLVSLLQSLLVNFASLGRANVSLDKLDELGFSLEGESMPSAGVDRQGESAPSFEFLELVGITHRYRHERKKHEIFTLGPLDLSFEPGELVIIAGGNGSGKTTLAKLILALYWPESGEIRLDHQLITEENVDSYRQLFSVVFSDFFLFGELLGLESDGIDERARRYLEKLQLEHKVEVEDGKLSTVELSQGQRKRLALLTSYLEDRPIFLFDEWAADQDPYFKNVFYRELLPELKAQGKCVIVISHDDHYYDVADRILRLDYGQLEYDAQRSDNESGKLRPPTERTAASGGSSMIDDDGERVQGDREA